MIRKPYDFAIDPYGALDGVLAKECSVRYHPGLGFHSQETVVFSIDPYYGLRSRGLGFRDYDNFNKTPGRSALRLFGRLDPETRTSRGSLAWQPAHCCQVAFWEPYGPVPHNLLYGPRDYIKVPIHNYVEGHRSATTHLLSS